MKTKHEILLAACFLMLAAPASGQWQTTTYTLKGGWNAIYLHGAATHATPDVLFASGDAANIEQIWRWNPNPTQIQFTHDPLIPSAGTPEWSVWYRNPQAGQTSTLSALTGQAAYLVKCSGSAANSYSVALKNRPLPPSATWVRIGANLLGFPTNPIGGFPSISAYFATFPVAVATESKIYKYIGGDLGPANPMQVFSPISEPLARNHAYWFEAKVTGNFHAPLEIAPSNPAGLEFGRTISVLAVRLRNRTSAPVTMTISPTPSAAAPTGVQAISGDVPLTYRAFNSGTGQVDEIVLGSPFSQVIGPRDSVELEFGIARAAMTGGSGALYASFLKFTDSGNLMDVLIPASAQVASMAGLWVGDVEVTGVQSTVAGSPGSTTPRPFPLRYILHVDDGGTARILSQVFLGTLAASDQLGICTSESSLKLGEKAAAIRMVAAHMPLDRVLPGTGNVGLGTTLASTISLPFDDGTNPFVHQYHPDHDNKDARGDALGAGVESYAINRAVSFHFLASPPAGTTSTGWGTTVLGGNYTETIAGIHKQTLTTTGTFTFHRVSEIGAITAP